MTSDFFLTEGGAAQRIEECEIPREFASLPGNIASAPAMREGLRAVKFSSGLNESRFTRCWLTSPAETLLTAFVWRTICTHFVADPIAADRLFSQLAASYARLFANSTLSAETKDTLTWYLPEALVHTTSQVLQSAFPRSRHAIDAKFRSVIFSEFISITSGFTGQRQRTLEVDRMSGGTQLAPQRKRMSAPGGFAVAPSGDASSLHTSPRQRVPRVPLAQLLGGHSELACCGGAGSGTSQEGGRVEKASVPAVVKLVEPRIDKVSHTRGRGGLIRH